MHILFESHGLDEYGESEMYQAFRIVLQATQYAEVSVVLPERWGNSVPSLKAAGARIITVPYDSWRHPGPGALDYMYAVFAHQARIACQDIMNTVDIVHRLNPNAVRYVSELAFTGKPFLIGPLGWSRIPKAWSQTPAASARNMLKTLDKLRIGSPWTRLRRMYDATDRVLLVNSVVRDVFPRQLKSKCQVIGDWVDTEFYSYMPPVQKTIPRIVFVGRLVPFKGVEYLLEAVSRLKNYPWILDIVGDGPLQDKLKNLCIALGIAARVEFVGRLPREEVRNFYWDADICCFPGLNESSGIVNLEAIACGRPVVATAWAGPKEIITPECGFLASANTPETFIRDLEDALRTLIMQADLRLQMGEAGRRRAVEMYSWSAVGQRYRQLHECVANGLPYGY